jgi:hypothetical protein
MVAQGVDVTPYRNICLALCIHTNNCKVQTLPE